MEQGIAAFAERAGVVCRHGCEWVSTRHDDDDGFVIVTSDGEYRCRIAVFAVGMAQPWKPPIEGIDSVPHYVDLERPRDYADKRVFLVGKRNSAFEIADGLLPWARQLVLASPRSTRLSILTHSTAAARARYLQPYEDHALGGGTVVLDAAIERIERSGDGYRVHLQGTTRPGPLKVDCDRVVAATGFSVPLRDLPDLGVATFFQARLPAQTPFWESATVPGIFFAGAITQGSIGLKKHGIPSNSAAVHGFRYNARVLARYIAEQYFGVAFECAAVDRRQVVERLVALASHAPELWNQQSYLAYVFEFPEGDHARDCGIQPLAHFLDSVGTDAVALAIETDGSGDIHPTLYIRFNERVEEHPLASNPLHEYDTDGHRRVLAGVLSPWL
jgi:thioredoxin reductase